MTKTLATSVKTMTAVSVSVVNDGPSCDAKAASPAPSGVSRPMCEWQASAWSLVSAGGPSQRGDGAGEVSFGTAISMTSRCAGLCR
jgi:hypothetical protein